MFMLPKRRPQHEVVANWTVAEVIPGAEQGLKDLPGSLRKWLYKLTTLPIA
jgi:hypothetical protein